MKRLERVYKKQRKTELEEGGRKLWGKEIKVYKGKKRNFGASFVFFL